MPNSKVIPKILLNIKAMLTIYEKNNSLKSTIINSTFLILLFTYLNIRESAFEEMP